MTARQTGQRISKMTANRQKNQVRGVGRRQERTSNREKQRLIQLVACGIIFAGMVAAKLLLPAKMEQVSTSVSTIMKQNVDITAVFAAVGRAVSGEESVSASWGEIYQAVFNADAQDAVEVSAQTESDWIAIPTQICSLRAFAKGTGTSNEWLEPVAQESPDRTEDAASAENSAETNHATTEPTQTAATSKEQVNTMKLSYTLYSGDNLPDNVSMQQAILGFDYCTPVCATLSSGFGYREHPLEGEEKFHYGVDLAADTGTEIDCFADGTVTAVGESSSYGKYVIVSHADNYATLYAHCSAITVSSGAAVKEGQKIAEVGETGLATGPHLHFELHRGNLYLNPIYYVTTV